MKTVTRTEMARNTRSVLEDVRRGETTLIENHGRPEIAMLDILDYRLMQAALRFFSQPAETDFGPAVISEEPTPYLLKSEMVDKVLGQYLAGAISLGRAAEVIGIPWIALRERFLRLDIPVHVGPESLEDARTEVAAVRKWAAGQ